MMWAEIEGTPTTAMGALIVISIMLAGGLGWLLRHLFGTTLPAKEEAAREERELYKGESQAMRDLFERRQDKLLEHCKEEADRERQASERRQAQSDQRFETAMDALKEIQQSILNQNAIQAQLLSLIRQRTWTADMVTTAEDPIWSKTLDGVVTSWNGAAERLLGWRSSEVIGRSVYALIPPEGHEQERQLLAGLARGERMDRYETERLHRDGRRVRLSVTVSPIKDPAGRVVGISSIAREL
jgi:PAS domain S-box-containing protein